MFWNLFERIINAVRPNKESEQTPDASQFWPENSTEQPQDSHGFQEQETVSAAQENECQD